MTTPDTWRADPRDVDKALAALRRMRGSAAREAVTAAENVARETGHAIVAAAAVDRSS